MNGTGVDIQLAMSVTGLTMGALFTQKLPFYRDRIAVQQGGHSLSYIQLNSRVNRLVQVLVAHGISRGDVVAIVSENRMQYLEMELACAKLGAVIACQNCRMTDNELQHCVDIVGPSLLVHSEKYRDVCDRLNVAGIARLSLDDGYEELLAKASDAEPPDAAFPEDPFVILYTSGTTGYPKAATISHRAMIARAFIQVVDRAIFPDRTFIAWAPFFHISGTDPSLATLLHGGKVIVHDGYDASFLVRTLAEEDIGYLQLMPGIVESFVRELKSSNLRPRPILAVGPMADLVPKHLICEVTTLLQAPYRNTFGSTETGQPPAARGLIPIGVVPDKLSKTQSSYCQIRLVDEDDNEVPDGQPGEITVRGPSLFSGYWGAPEVTAHEMRGGWYHMGDVFVRNPDGTLDFVDRRKYVIKSGGENIYPAEIERVLLSSSRISEAVVVRRAHEKWGEEPVAFVSRLDDSLSADDVIAMCRNKISAFKIPRTVEFIAFDDFPRSITGKVKRQDLEARLKRGDAKAP